MGVPIVSSSDPLANATGVYKNKILTITFSEALLESSVNTGTIILRNLDIDEVVPVDISFSSDYKTVYVTPIRLLLENTAYRLSVTGTSTALTATGAIKSSSTSSELVTTWKISFRSGTEISVTNLVKTEDQIEDEGDIALPSNVTVLADTSYLTVLDTAPDNRSFWVEPDLDIIGVVFSETLDTSSVNVSNFVVTVTPYYEEDEDFLAFPDTSTGASNFKWQEPKDSEDELLTFTDPTGALTVTDDTIIWTADTSSLPFPRNSKVTVSLYKGIKGVSGETLQFNQRFVFYIEPYPDVVSVERIRDAFFPYVLSKWTDDMIGKTIYKNALEALNVIRWDYDCRKVNKIFREYVLYATVLDIFQTNKINDDMKAGQFKRLGDLAIRYDSKMGESFPAAMIKAMEKAESLKETLTRRFSGTMRWAVKGRQNAEQRTIWRTRVWRQDMLFALQGVIYPLDSAGNTGYERSTKVPGQYDQW